jgi:hypothetical protein
MIFWPCDSRISAWIESGMVPSSLTKCGFQPAQVLLDDRRITLGNIPSSVTIGRHLTHE